MVYWASVVPVGGSTFELMFRYPMGNVLWVGLILGDVPTAMVIGATLQPAYLGMLQLGSVIPADQASAGIIPAACVIAYGMDTDTAIALAVPVSLLFAQISTIWKTLCSVCYRMADKAIENRQYNGIFMAHCIVANAIKVLLYWVPMSALLLLGGEAISNAANALPAVVQSGFSVCSKMLPAAGFAMIIKMIGKVNLLPYFLAGFFFYQYSKLGSIAIGLVAFFLAYLHHTYTSGESESGLKELFQGADDSQSYKLVTKNEVGKLWWRWIVGSHWTDGYERLKGLDFTWAMLPFFKKVYANRPDELQDSLRRHMVFYNTTPDFGNAVIMGIVVSLEEQKAIDDSVPGEVISNLKNGLMGPFAGIGDTLSYGVIRPIVFSFFISAGLAGKWWAGLVPVAICWFIFNYLYGYCLYQESYKLGAKAAEKLLQGGVFQKLLDFFSVLGMFSIGGISAQNVKVQCGINLTFSDGTIFSIQEKLFNSLAPGLVSLIVILAFYAYLNKGGKVTTGIIGLVVIGLITGMLGVLV